MKRNIKGKGGKHLGEVNVLVEGPIGGAIVVFAVVVVGARHLHPPDSPSSDGLKKLLEVKKWKGRRAR